MSAAGTSSLTAAAILHAKRITRAGELPQACLCCGREAPLARIVIQKGAAAGPVMGSGAYLLAGVCDACVAATSEEREAAVSELATAAAHVDALLELVRRRARQQLAPWWGGIGACRAEDVDEASVALRRALERLGV